MPFRKRSRAILLRSKRGIRRSCPREDGLRRCPNCFHTSFDSTELYRVEANWASYLTANPPLNTLELTQLSRLAVFWRILATIKTWDHWVPAFWNDPILNKSWDSQNRPAWSRFADPTLLGCGAHTLAVGRAGGSRLPLVDCPCRESSGTSMLSNP